MFARGYPIIEKFVLLKALKVKIINKLFGRNEKVQIFVMTRGDVIDTYVG
jgi:hypothetical protein